MGDPVDDFDLSDWPDALAAYRTAHELGRRTRPLLPPLVDTSDTIRARDDAARELARLRARVGLRGLDAAGLARVRLAILWGEADGRAGDGPRW